MASRLATDVSCPVCHDVFTDPVVLSCKHSFCKDCLQKFWADRQTSECLLCKRRSSIDIPCYFSLKSQCEVCSLHSEKLSLFCLDDQQLLCSVCEDSVTHSSHRIQHVDIAAQDGKESLLDSLKPLRIKLKLIHQVKGNCVDMAEHIKGQAENAVRGIKEEFSKLRPFLDDEEEARIGKVKAEEEEKSWMINKTIEALSREIAALSDTIRATEEELRAEDVPFLQNYKTTVERVQQQPLPSDPELVSGALIDVAKHLGNLSFHVWNEMKTRVSYSVVILDTNTAHPEMILSKDLTSMRHGARQQQLPDNPERIDFTSARGSEGFESRSGEVEVGEYTAFVLGVVAALVQREGIISSRF